MPFNNDFHNTFIDNETKNKLIFFLHGSSRFPNFEENMEPTSGSLI